MLVYSHDTMHIPIRVHTWNLKERPTRPLFTGVVSWTICLVASYSLRLQTAQSRPCLCTLGSRVCVFCILGDLGYAVQYQCSWWDVAERQLRSTALFDHLTGALQVLLGLCGVLGSRRSGNPGVGWKVQKRRHVLTPPRAGSLPSSTNLTGVGQCPQTFHVPGPSKCRKQLPA